MDSDWSSNDLIERSRHYRYWIDSVYINAIMAPLRTHDSLRGTRLEHASCSGRKACETVDRIGCSPR